MFVRLLKLIVGIIPGLWEYFVYSIPLVKKLKEELEVERMRLAGCGVVAMQNTSDSLKERIGRDNPYWSASYADVCRAVDAEIMNRELLKRECNDIDAVILHLGWEPEDFRTDGGFLNVGKLKSALSDVIRPGAGG